MCLDKTFLVRKVSLPVLLWYTQKFSCTGNHINNAIHDIQIGIAIIALIPVCLVVTTALWDLPSQGHIINPCPVLGDISDQTAIFIITFEPIGTHGFNYFLTAGVLMFVDLGRVCLYNLAGTRPDLSSDSLNVTNQRIFWQRVRIRGSFTHLSSHLWRDRAAPLCNIFLGDRVSLGSKFEWFIEAPEAMQDVGFAGILANCTWTNVVFISNISTFDQTKCIPPEQYLYNNNFHKGPQGQNTSSSGWNKLAETSLL